MSPLQAKVFTYMHLLKNDFWCSSFGSKNITPNQNQTNLGTYVVNKENEKNVQNVNTNNSGANKKKRTKNETKWTENVHQINDIRIWLTDY